MTNEERMATSIDQIYTYGNCQYTKWRVAVVKSIQKILLNLGNCSVHPRINVKFQKEKREVVSNNKP